MGHPNLLLDSLSAKDRQSLWPNLKTVELSHGEVLARSQEDIKRVYFPHSGIISFMVETRDGRMVQTGMVGRDGAVGAIQALDDRVSLNKIIVHVPGEASVVDADRVRAAAQASPIIRSLLVSHEEFFVADVQQSVACNALHHVEPRMCRWLLRMNDLVGMEMPLTQDLLSAMLGVRRTTVSIVASSLQNTGVIEYSRGRFHILNIHRLKKLSCECYGTVREQYDRLFKKRY
jgi:CRP-like cAMP-binding protein